MKLQNLFFRKWIGLLLVTLVLLAGCGGGGGDEGAGTNSAGNGVINGMAVKGPVSNATISAFSINSNGAKGAQIG